MWFGCFRMAGPSIESRSCEVRPCTGHIRGCLFRVQTCTPYGIPGAVSTQARCPVQSRTFQLHFPVPELNSLPLGSLSYLIRVARAEMLHFRTDFKNKIHLKCLLSGRTNINRRTMTQLRVQLLPYPR